MKVLLLTCSYAAFKTQDGHTFSARTFDGTTRDNIQKVQTTTDQVLGYSAVIDTVKNIILDGMNCIGLSISALGQERAVYQTVPEGKEKQALLVNEIGPYILGTCATVQEVKETLESFYVHGNQDTPLLSFAFCDAEGKQLFVEYVDGKPTFRELEDEPGILTENAEPSWFNQKGPQTADNKGPTSAERFQRLVKAFQETKQPENCANGQYFAYQLMNRVTIKKGEWWVFPGEGKNLPCYTQYTVIRDHKNKQFSYSYVDEVPK